MLSAFYKNLWPPRWVVWKSMGNDLYPPGSDRIPLSKLVHAIEVFLRTAHNYWCPKHSLVFGGLSRTWGYSEKFGPDRAKAYDAGVQAIVDSMSIEGYDVQNGADLLEGIVTVDTIGHVSDRSLPVLYKFFIALSQRWYMQ